MDSHIYWNRGTTLGFFEVGEAAGIRTYPAGGASGAAFADYDGDGDLDLAIVRLFGEGDTRSALMTETRKRAARRRLFAGCLEDLRQAQPPLSPDLLFSCVDRARAELPKPA